MQKKILVSPKKGVGCKFQKPIDHGNKGKYFTLSIRIQLAGCCYMHAKSRFQIILTTHNAFIVIHYPKIQMSKKNLKK